jgi:nitrile hydratase subunit beta
MNGAHDMGGMMSFGPIVAPPSESVFHEEWEGRMAALMMAIGDIGGWNIDQDRSACEAMHPAKYLKTSYYEHWLHGLQQLLKTHTPKRPLMPTRPEDVWNNVTAASSYIRDIANPARFEIGQSVRVKILNPKTHTRVPRYVRGRVGEIISIHGAHVFPDSNALGLGENPQWLYNVRFTANELWDHVTNDVTHLDLWEPYLAAV